MNIYLHVYDIKVTNVEDIVAG